MSSERGVTELFISRLATGEWWFGWQANEPSEVCQLSGVLALFCFEQSVQKCILKQSPTMKGTLL